jgi:BTB/POZ domain
MATPTSMSPFCDGDWQNERSVLDANRYMLENQVDCDVMFTLLPSGGGVVDTTDAAVPIGSHRYILISRSPVFFAMLTGPLAKQSPLMMTSSKNIPKEIRITDIAPSTFWQLLR